MGEEEEEEEEEESPSPRKKAKAASLFFLDSFISLWIFSLLTSSIPLLVGLGAQKARNQSAPRKKAQVAEGTSSVRQRCCLDHLGEKSVIEKQKLISI